MIESTLNKSSAFNLNDRLRPMMGNPANHLNFRQIMDSGKIVIVDLGSCDAETRGLIGSLVVTGFEIAMRNRKHNDLYTLFLDEFAAFVANEGSTKTLSDVLSEGRKMGLALCVSHQGLHQLSPKIIDALGTTQKVIFGISRPDAEHFARLIGYIEPNTIRETPRSAHEQFTPLADQWEQWIDRLRFQAPRQATVANARGQVHAIRTISVPAYTASDEAVEAVKLASLKCWGVPYHEADRQSQQPTHEFV